MKYLLGVLSGAAVVVLINKIRRQRYLDQVYKDVEAANYETGESYYEEDICDCPHCGNCGCCTCSETPADNCQCNDDEDNNYLEEAMDRLADKVFRTVMSDICSWYK